MSGSYPDRRPRRLRPVNHLMESRRSARLVLRELADDVGYLEFKERLGEPLSPSERVRLEAARSGSGSDPKPIGGGS